MLSIKRVRQYALIFLAGAMLAACANQREPAQKMINDIEAAVNAASADAAKYVPDQLIGVQTKLGDLKASFARGDYKYVVQAAPAVLSEAQGLASAAAAKKAEVAKELNDQWTSLSSAVPGYVTAIQNRIDLLEQEVEPKAGQGNRSGCREIRLERCDLALVQGAGRIRQWKYGRSGDGGKRGEVQTC